MPPQLMPPQLMPPQLMPAGSVTPAACRSRKFGFVSGVGSAGGVRAMASATCATCADGSLLMGRALCTRAAFTWPGV